MLVMLIDDDQAILNSMEKVLKSFGYDCHAFNNGEEAVEAYKNAHYDAVISDYKMPGMNGEELLDNLKQHDPDAQVIIMTGFPELDMTINILNLGAYAFLKKPPDFEKILNLLEKIGKEAAPVSAEDTDSQLTANERRHLRKMAFLGTISSELSHEYKNIFSVINLMGEHTLSQLSKTDPVYQQLSRIVKSSKLAEEIARQVLNHTVCSQQANPLSAEIVLNEVIEMLELEFSQKGIEVITDFNYGGRVRISRTCLSQIVLNICLNALNSMDKTTVKRLDLTTKYHKLTSSQLPYKNMLPGFYALISISDTGRGMSEDTKAHLFDPSFTSREYGSGHGLGLKITSKIITELNGCVVVDSIIEQGSTFSIYLPSIPVEPTTSDDEGDADA